MFWHKKLSLLFLNLAPIFAGIAMYRIMKGREPGWFYFLSGIPITYLWFSIFINDASYMMWKYSYIGGKLILLISILILITSFVPLKTIVDTVKKQLYSKGHLKG